MSKNVVRRPGELPPKPRSMKWAHIRHTNFHWRFYPSAFPNRTDISRCIRLFFYPVYQADRVYNTIFRIFHDVSHAIP